MHGQTIPSGGAYIVKRNIGFCKVDVLDFAVNTRKGAYQSLCRPFALQVFKQSQQGTLTCVQGDVVHKVKQTRLIQRPQFSVDIAATQHNGHTRMMLFDALRHAQSTIDRAREGY